MKSKWLTTLFFALLTSLFVSAQDITTVVGPELEGFPALEVGLKPVSVVADSSGNLFVATYSHQVFKVDTSGIITTVAGDGYRGYSGDGGPASSARLSYPRDVVVDTAGNLYIADMNNQRIRKVDAAGTITTVAGDGYSGFSGDGGPATGARLSYPIGVAVDAAGNLYIADMSSQRIRRVDAGGIITTVAGDGYSGYSGDGGPATGAGLKNPYGVAVDAVGNFYIADTSNQRIRRVDADGVITTVAGNGYPGYSGDGGPATSARLYYPIGVAVDAAGDLYIADTGNQRIRKVDVEGVITTVAGNGSRGYSGDGGPAIDARLASPYDITVDAAGNFYFASPDNNRIRRVDADGVITTVVGNGSTSYSGLGNPIGTAVDEAGTLYIAETFSQRIRKLDTNGTITTVAGSGSYGYSGDGGPADGARFANPYGVAVDAAGDLYIADTGNQRIRKVDVEGVITTVAGDGYRGYSGDGGPAAGARLANPYGVAIDGVGNLYIADTFNNCIRRVDADGIITTVAGNGYYGYSGDGGPAPHAQLAYPFGIAVDAAGNLYIADTSNQRIRRVDADGIITTIAGDGLYGYDGDGGPAASARLNSPHSVAVDAAGTLYIADTSNNRIRRVDADGIITTVAGNGLYGYDGDGGPAVDARLANPFGVAVFGVSRLYIADTNNRRIRMVLLNSPPVAENRAVFTEEDEALNITLAASDPDDDLLAYHTLPGGPTNGVLSGSLPFATYTPHPDYFGPDSFQFYADDGELESNIATVSIEVVPVNDLPRALEDAYSTDEDATLTISAPGLLANDSDVEDDLLTVAPGTEPSHGSLALSPDGSFTYVPEPDFNGFDFFHYLARDHDLGTAEATVHLTVKPVNDPPVAHDQWVVTDEDIFLPITLSGGDVDGDPIAFALTSLPTNGTLEGEAPDLVYTPELNYYGADSFAFKVNDGELDSETAWVNIEVNPVNDPPVVDAGPDLPPEGEALREGDVLSIVAHFSDVDSAGHTTWIDWADGTGPQPGSVDQANWTVSASHVYADDGAYSVTVTVQDAEGAASGDGLAASVGNAAPLVTSLAAPLDPVSVDEADIEISADFRDAATLDTHSCTIDWGDDTSSVEPVEEAPYGPPGSTEGLTGTLAAGHLYAEAGVYRITLAITDDDGGQGSAGYEYVVVYDPDGGFVTGGGWIDSPEGAYAADPELAGRASFGFVSKYRRGAEAPTGETEFQFKVADLNFHSDSYDWLVVAGPRAQFKGTGTINGQGSFGFLLSAVDGEISGGGGEDKFRIKIWDQDEDVMVYDNQMGEADDSPVSTIIGGGSIVIHKR